MQCVGGPTCCTARNLYDRLRNMTGVNEWSEHFIEHANVAQGQQRVEILLCRLLSLSHAHHEYSLHTTCMPTTAVFGHANVRRIHATNSGPRRRAAAQLSVQRQRRTARRLASQQRQLAAAPQSGDEYVAIERHRMRRWTGEARRRKSDVFMSLVARTRVHRARHGWRPSVADD